MTSFEGSRLYFSELGNYTQPRDDYYVPNRKVAVEPFISTSPQVKGGTFKVAQQKVELPRLKVVFGNERYRPGSFVYVRGDVRTMPWVGEVFEMNGVRFILIPEDYIQMVDNGSSGDSVNVS